VRLADLRGRPIWLNFFATWCPPCQYETPVLQQVYEAHAAQGLALVAVSVQETAPEDVAAYAATYGLTYTIAFDATSAIFRTYKAYGLPTHYFIDRDGVIRAVWRGPLTVEKAEALLAPLLAP
jgi:peroxiredoxin